MITTIAFSISFVLILYGIFALGMSTTEAIFSNIQASWNESKQGTVILSSLGVSLIVLGSLIFPLINTLKF